MKIAKNAKFPPFCHVSYKRSTAVKKKKEQDPIFSQIGPENYDLNRCWSLRCKAKQQQRQQQDQSNTSKSPEISLSRDLNSSSPYFSAYTFRICSRCDAVRWPRIEMIVFSSVPQPNNQQCDRSKLGRGFRKKIEEIWWSPNPKDIVLLPMKALRRRSASSAGDGTELGTVSVDICLFF